MENTKEGRRKAIAVDMQTLGSQADGESIYIRHVYGALVGVNRPALRRVLNELERLQEIENEWEAAKDEANEFTLSSPVYADANSSSIDGMRAVDRMLTRWAKEYIDGDHPPDDLPPEVEEFNDIVGALRAMIRSEERS